MTYYLAPSLVALRDEVNTHWPERDTSSDGWIGDTAHSSRASDHNPDEKGCVHAIDVDVDGINVQRLLSTVVGDPRVWYVIYNRVIRSRTYDWTPHVYTGSNPHEHHVHISIRYEPFAEQSQARWFDPHKTRTKGGRLPAVDLSRVVIQAKDATEYTLDVRRVQHVLNVRYHAGLTVDGWWGWATTDAYRAFERAVDAPQPNGTPGQASLSRLGQGRFRVLD